MVINSAGCAQRFLDNSLYKNVSEKNLIHLLSTGVSMHFKLDPRQ